MKTKNNLAIPTLIAVTVAVSILVAFSATASAGTINVDCDDTSCVVVSGQSDPYSVVYCSIQDAIDDAAIDDTIEVAAGIYTENVAVNKQVTLLGAEYDNNPAGGLDRGGESVIVGQVTITADDATVNGFKLSGNRVYVNGADDVIVSYNIVVDSSMHGIRLDSSSPNAQILYNTISNPNWEGICNYEGNTGVKISHNHITGVTDQHAIVSGMHTGSNIEITHNVISGVTNAKGINYWGGNGAVISYNQISNTGWEAIFSDTEAIIEGNVIYNSDNNGINLYSGADNSVVRDNTISDCQFTAINVLADSVSVEDNIISNCGGDGVWVDAEDVSVKGNSISSISYAGINVRAGCTNAEITDNDISGCGTGIETHVGAITGASVNCNNIAGNSWGVRNHDSGLLDAENNWWGDTSGPSGEGPGTGDAVSTNVDFDPWSFTPDPCEAKTLGFWKNHEDSVDAVLVLVEEGQIDLGGFTVDNSVDATAVFNNAKNKNANTMLAAQLLAAKLNVAHLDHLVIDYCECIDDVITAANAFLSDHGYTGPAAPGTAPTGPDKQEANGYKDDLDAYNQGLCPCTP